MHTYYYVISVFNIRVINTADKSPFQNDLFENVHSVTGIALFKLEGGG